MNNNQRHMIALSHPQGGIWETLQTAEHTAKEPLNNPFFKILRKVYQVLKCREITRSQKKVSKIIDKILISLETMPSERPHIEVHTAAKEFLASLRTSKTYWGNTNCYSKKLDKIFTANIDKAYIIEKKIRLALYKDITSEETDLGAAVRRLSKKRAAEVLHNEFTQY